MIVPPFLARTNLRVCLAFWLLGLINNVLYVIILSAALDLVGPSTPKGVVLLADVLPSFLTKLTAPYYIHLLPYPFRVSAFVFLSACGMLIIAMSPPSKDTLATLIKLFGVSLASISSGAGELSFLGLTHHYGHRSLASWSSGTGGAGLVGAGAYVLATTTLGLTSRTSLIAFAFLPIIMLLSFFVVLPTYAVPGDYQAIATGDDDEDLSATHTDEEEDQRLASSLPAEPGAQTDVKHTRAWTLFRANVKRAKGLFLPYMLPLLLVYIAEYTINQGVAPTLLFPLASSGFQQYRDFYPLYGFIYQVGVFVSRSSISFIRIHHLYAPSILQWFNLLLLTLHAMYNFLPNVWVVCIVIFWEGLLGGLVYVSTFAEITDNVPMHEREFSLAATTVSDSAGICIAALLSMALETGLCDWQVAHSRNYCRRL